MSPAAARKRSSALNLALWRAQQATSPDGILVVDEAGHMVSFNRRFVRMWGIPRRVILSRSDERALESVLGKLVDPQGFLARVQYLYRHKKERSTEELVLKDSRTFERHSAPIFDGKNKYLGRIWYFRDITNRKRAEEMARDNERLRMQREFVANVSHELRTPLTAIEGFTETLLQGEIKDTRNRRAFLRTISRHALRLRRLVESLLEISQLESGKTGTKASVIELRPFLKEILEGFRPLIKSRGVEVDLSTRPGLSVSINETYLSRIVGNLLDNAIKFSPSGSRVEVRVKSEGNRILVTVQDRGLGIAADDLPHIFERFRRSSTALRRGIQGTGLGLAMVKQLVEKHGGRVWVRSKEGKGSSFYFTLPRYRIKRKRESKSSRAKAASRARRS